MPVPSLLLLENAESDELRYRMRYALWRGVLESLPYGWHREGRIADELCDDVACNPSTHTTTLEPFQVVVLQLEQGLDSSEGVVSGSLEACTEEPHP